MADSLRRKSHDDYERMTSDDDRDYLETILMSMQQSELVSVILGIGDVYSEVREEFNNQILDSWAAAYDEQHGPPLDQPGGGGYDFSAFKVGDWVRDTRPDDGEEYQFGRVYTVGGDDEPMEVELYPGAAQVDGWPHVWTVEDPSHVRAFTPTLAQVAEYEARKEAHDGE